MSSTIRGRTSRDITRQTTIVADYDRHPLIPRAPTQKRAKRSECLIFDRFDHGHSRMLLCERIGRPRCSKGNSRRSIVLFHPCTISTGPMSSCRLLCRLHEYCFKFGKFADKLPKFSDQRFRWLQVLAYKARGLLMILWMCKCRPLSCLRTSGTNERQVFVNC